MLTLGQKVSVHCTDTEVNAKGVIVRIRPDGFDVDIADGTLTVGFYKHKPGIYVGNKSGMEFVVKTEI